MVADTSEAEDEDEDGNADAPIADFDVHLYLVKPAALALLVRMSRSCFSLYGANPMVVHANSLDGTLITVAMTLIRG